MKSLRTAWARPARRLPLRRRAGCVIAVYGTRRPGRAAGRSLWLALALSACQGGDPGAEGWFDTGRADRVAQFSADVATVYALSLPPHWCTYVAGVAETVFAGEWTLAEGRPDSPLRCGLPLDLPGEPRVQVELAPYFVFDWARADQGGDRGLRVAGAPAFYPDAFSVSVAVHQRLALTVSMTEVDAPGGPAAGVLQAQAVRLAEALLPALQPTSAPAGDAVPRSAAAD